MTKTGIPVEPEAAAAYTELQDKHLHKFVVLGFNDKNNKIELKNVGPLNSTFEDLMAVVPKDHVRYIFYDCEYTLANGQSRNKVIMVSWSSDDDAPAKEKMLVTGSKDEVKAKCKNHAKATTINDYSELTEENFINIVSENRTK